MPTRDATSFHCDHAADSARHRALLERAEQLAQLGSGSLDLRTGASVWTDGMYRLHGLDRELVAPGGDALLARVHPGDRERIMRLLSAIVADPDTVPAEGVVAEYRALLPDGTLREIRIQGCVERDEDGIPTDWVVAAQDVTDQRLTERELHAHYAVSQALRDWESFEEGVVGLLRRLGTALDYPVGTLWIPDRRDERLEARAFWTADGVDVADFEDATRDVSFARGQGVPGCVWATGQPLVVEDVAPRLRFGRRAAAERLGLRSAVAFAADGDDGSLAVVSFYSFERRAASERLVRTLTGIGAELGRFLTRRRAELAPGRLSARELEVLKLAAEGNTGPEIAEQLFVSPATVKTHFQHVYEKLGVGDRAAAVAHALRIGLIR